MIKTLDQVISELRMLFDSERGAIKDREKYQKMGAQSAGFQDELDDMATKYIKVIENKIANTLGNLVRFPPHYRRHSDQLKVFYEKYKSSYENSIFVMTKFPDGDSDEDSRLKEDINLVLESIKACGYCPRIASGDYHPILWDNVELYIIGCSKGVAIVQDRYKPEFNPNVAIEWGCMRGMGKEVLFLVEEKFVHNRADWEGFIRHQFSWDNPEASVRTAIKKWLHK